MATTRTASAHWEGSLMEGAGQVSLESSGVGTFDVSWPSRAEAANGRTSPEELIAAAHSTCFSMALSNGLAKAGTPPTTIDTTAEVTFQPGTGITGIVLKVLGDVPGMSAAEFEEAAQAAKTGCPVSQALSAVPISLEVSFAGEDRA
jgi:lipoyl-dependent peroxiredoxin